jgi:hypothetical protein
MGMIKPTDIDWSSMVRGPEWDRASILWVKSIFESRLAELNQAPYRSRAIIRKK